VKDAQRQATFLIAIVQSDPNLMSRFQDDLAVLQKTMTDIVRTVEEMQDRTSRTEQRVDNIETRVDQLELRPQPCKCVSVDFVVFGQLDVSVSVVCQDWAVQNQDKSGYFSTKTANTRLR